MAETTQLTQSPQQASVITARPAEWWFVELWYEHRPLFKELVKHFFVFGTVFGTLEGFHWLLGKSHIDPHRLQIVDTFHFWGSIILLVIFIFSLTIKVLLFETGLRK